MNTAKGGGQGEDTVGCRKGTEGQTWHSTEVSKTGDRLVIRSQTGPLDFKEKL